MIAVIIGHIYLGSVGVRGSFDAMATRHGSTSTGPRRTTRSGCRQEIERHQIDPDGLHPAE